MIFGISSDYANYIITELERIVGIKINMAENHKDRLNEFIIKLYARCKKDLKKIIETIIKDIRESLNLDATKDMISYISMRTINKYAHYLIVDVGFKPGTKVLDFRERLKFLLSPNDRAIVEELEKFFTTEEHSIMEIDRLIKLNKPPRVKIKVQGGEIELIPIINEAMLEYVVESILLFLEECCIDYLILIKTQKEYDKRILRASKVLDYLKELLKKYKPEEFYLISLHYLLSVDEIAEYC